MIQRVLIIDDSQNIHALVKARLAAEPVELHCAFDGITGIAMAAQVLPDLILVDIDLPDPDGFEVCRRLKSQPATMSIPIVFLTGAASTDEKIRGLELGAVDYITKPFEPAELRARVRAALRTKFLLDLLAKKAMIDGLTGLWNRTYFDQTVAAQLSLARRSGQAVSCILADLDHFKTVNDRFGHLSGDEALRVVAACFQAQCRIEDVVCRFGGEELAVIVPNTPANKAAVLADRLRGAVEKLVLKHRGLPVPLTCSFGIADAVTAADKIVESADAALCRAKTEGRNRIAIAPAAAQPVTSASTAMPTALAKAS
jgi:two-component system, cell cycle response regulator